MPLPSGVHESPPLDDELKGRPHMFKNGGFKTKFGKQR
jgi:hypothetical protein